MTSFPLLVLITIELTFALETVMLFPLLVMLPAPAPVAALKVIPASANVYVVAASEMLRALVSFAVA